MAVLLCLYASMVIIGVELILHCNMKQPGDGCFTINNRKQSELRATSHADSITDYKASQLAGYRRYWVL